MRKYLCGLLFLLLSSVAVAQNKSVTFDYLGNNFNNNQPLPAEEKFTVKGNIDKDIVVITLEVFKNHNSKSPVYATQWRRPIGNNLGKFSMPVDFKLHGNRDYDVVLHFYRKMDKSERIGLLEAIKGNLQAYIRSIVEISPRKLSFRSSEETTIENMNKIVWSAMSYYRSTLPMRFPGFSSIIENKIDRLSNQKITHARYNVAHDSAVMKTQIRQKYAAQLKKQLLQAAMQEVKPYVNDKLAVLEDVRRRESYPTEEITRTLSLNVGYGGVYLSGQWDDMDYASAPYVGISFPLGNESLSPFWGNASVSLGVFLKNFEDKNGNEITGPIVGLPYYVGLGYKFLHVFRFQAGVVATSTEKIDNIQNISTKDFDLKPFVGVSAEINLWLGFDKKK